MKAIYVQQISKNTQTTENQINTVIQLFNEKCTVPFISRYRKERTGGLDEVSINEIDLWVKKFDELEKRKQTILKNIEEAGHLTPDLQQKIENTLDAQVLEDIYLPYKPKKRTKATIAKELGLEPLAKILMTQQSGFADDFAQRFVNEKVSSSDQALAGARDIIAEWVNENQYARKRLRNLYNRDAIIRSRLVKNKEDEAQKYRDYFDYHELLKKCPSHRMLAIRRAEAEGFLKVSVAPDEDEALEILEDYFIKGYTDSAEQIRLAIKDSYKRLVQPSMENEFKKLFKEKADTTAIEVFAQNLRQLLMASPLGSKRVLALDPGFRTGCKVVCLNENGDLLSNEAIYPNAPQFDFNGASKSIYNLVQKYKIEAIAIGNGTASRETDQFIKSLKLPDMAIYMVNESGASIYSASEVAREEFPEHDVTVRGAVSIGRRLMDPLAELVKIDPKSIGVGQYQHDVDQSKLKESLDFVVESCVNTVGVNLNTASKHLLSYVSGLGPKLAENIVTYRIEQGPFKNRKQLKKVPRMGEKAFEQSAGFLRITNGENPLDNTAVHPESYWIVEKMAKDKHASLNELIKNKETRKAIQIQQYTSDKAGIITLKDIMAELEKPGRDPREQIKTFEFAEGIHEITDLKEGMILPGLVTNITNFGAFVDVGVHQDGLVHISEMANKYVANPEEIVKLNQEVSVKVIFIDMERKRIQLSMKNI